MTRSPALALCALLAACSTTNMGSTAADVGGGMDGVADVGVTAGGSQDINEARELIEAGYIPGADEYTAEGLFSEHDLPMDAQPCAEVLCPAARAAVIDPVDGSGPQLLVQLGFGTVYAETGFERRPLSLSVAVDISGSMAGGKLGAVRDALHVLVAQLDEGDQMGLVAFDDRATVVSALVTMDEAGRAAMDASIDRLATDGGTNIEAGLAKAYAQVEAVAGAEGVEERVMLFTDAQPNVGATDSGSFVGLVSAYAEQDIGVSVFGVGLDLGSELATVISETRGGNYFFLSDEDEIRQVFDDEFDFMVSPIAYDLDVAVVPADGLHIGAAYGAPTGDDAVAFGASTLFLSSRDGGMGIALIDPDAADFEGGMDEVAGFHLSYVALDGKGTVEQDLAVGYQGGSVINGVETLADDVGVYKMGALVVAVLALDAGAGFCVGALDQDAAAARIEEATARVAEAGALLEDDGLMDLAATLEQLAANVIATEPRCHL